MTTQPYLKFDQIGMSFVSQMATEVLVTSTCASSRASSSR